MGQDCVGAAGDQDFGRTAGAADSGRPLDLEAVACDLEAVALGANGFIAHLRAMRKQAGRHRNAGPPRQGPRSLRHPEDVFSQAVLRRVPVILLGVELARTEAWYRRRLWPPLPLRLRKATGELVYAEHDGPADSLESIEPNRRCSDILAVSRLSLTVEVRHHPAVRRKACPLPGMQQLRACGINRRHKQRSCPPPAPAPTLRMGLPGQPAVALPPLRGLAY